MDKFKGSLHNKVHHWIDAIGFRLNTSQISGKNKVTTNHYFFETFNFFEKWNGNEPAKAKFLCFDTYGEKVSVKTLLDLQTAFFENISQLK
ncbi:hypothetical protein [Mucilaginibacter phyllosphaerae]|uniref:Uncharacterized protein n=1 Tax=Mucilaginibacter phyllosphaerae TaxID=1812349 RepID=A0A4Y8AES4_9SPHI|nr:hypothetical protein [Mucilaginibacter phyllosphaerae]MBB3970176.1 hypothetical protein [Mucilaginibacter phyllosphaerae]TEW66561.1 hypothetical protein E2R65_09045 [Mucilaginibacter phyllosphaerae]GGH10303.1 hypothetical protein GCM10007352_16060 [Mucilaginibacter phyllosphaerae]